MQFSNPDYKKYLQLVLRRRVLFTVLALLMMTGTIAATLSMPSRYQSTSTVFIEKNVIGELVKGLTVTPSMEDTISVLTYAITSRALLTKVVDRLNMRGDKSETDLEGLIKDLQANTQVKVKDKNLFTISFTDRDPRVARDFVNTLVRLYIEQNVSSKRGESSEATEFLNEQIATFNAKLEKAEREVNNYKREKGGIIAIDEGKLFEEINQAQQKLYDLELKRRQLEGMRQLTRKSHDPLHSKLSALQKKHDELLVQYTESFPEVVQVKSDIEAIKEQLKGRKGGRFQSADTEELAKLESEVAAIRMSEEGLRRYISTNRNLLQHIPAAKAGLDKLEMERQNQKKMYDQLFVRQGQSEVSNQIEVQEKSTSFRVVDPAILPVKPSGPNRLKLMLMGIAGAIAGSFALLLLLEQMDGSVKDVDFVKGLGAPVLAIIPRMRDSALVARQHRRSVCFFSAAAVYFLLILCFPVMEYLELHYMDKVLDNVSSVNRALGITGVARASGSTAK